VSISELSEQETVSSKPTASNDWWELWHEEEQERLNMENFEQLLFPDEDEVWPESKYFQEEDKDAHRGSPILRLIHLIQLIPLEGTVRFSLRLLPSRPTTMSS
jgi:hypothetical protein